MCIELEDAEPYEMHAHEVYTLEELVRSKGSFIFSHCFNPSSNNRS